MSFQTGQQVECVDDRWVLRGGFLRRWRHRLSGPHPRRGGRYVVDEARRDEYGRVWLIIGGFARWRYLGARFRPLVDGEFERLVALAADPPKRLVKALQPAGVARDRQPA